MSDFKKNDKGKPELSMVPLDLLFGVNKVLQHGAKKYGVNNWKKTDFELHRAYNALLRHMIAFWEGQNNDPETGLSHLDHAMCNLLFMKYHFERTQGCDTRPCTLQNTTEEDNER